MGIGGRHPLLKIAAPGKQGSLHHWIFSKVRDLHTALILPYVYDNTL
jgi:hypothetical protein